MDTQEKADLQHVMIKALSDSLNAQFAATEQEYRLARYNDRKKRARAKKVKLPVDKGWTEKYALNVRHIRVVRVRYLLMVVHVGLKSPLIIWHHGKKMQFKRGLCT